MPPAKREAVRKAPHGAVFASHLPRKAGKCDWCGEPQTERTPVREKLRLRHAICDAEYACVASPEQARYQVFARDHGICTECGEDWSERYRFQKGAGVTLYLPGRDDADLRDQVSGFYRYTEVIWVSLWHGDHRVPLWKVAGLPDLQRIEFFKLPNLVTLCEPCHIDKTRKETAERFHFDRMAGIETKKPKRAWPKGRKLQGRGFR